MPVSKKFLASAALTASLAAGGVAGAMFGAPTVSSAQTEPSPRIERAERPSERPAGGGYGDVRPADRAGRAGEERPVHDGGHEGPGGHHPRRFAVEAAAEALGMTVEELKAELRNGKSVRAVAGERGVDVQVVIDAIVAAVTEHAEERATAFVDRALPLAEESTRN